MGKAKLLIIIIVILVFCFAPMINMPYDVVVEKQVSEEYTTIEPYIVQEAVDQPYTYQMPDGAYWQGDIGGHWVARPPRLATASVPVLHPVTKYREVTKTRLVTRPVVETQTKRVSPLRFMLK